MPTGLCAGSTTKISQKSVVRLVVAAKIIDHVADAPMFGHRDQLALHQAAGGFLRVGERFLDRGAIVGLHRAEHFALVVGVHVLDDRDGVVGIEFGGDVGDFVRFERVDQHFADVIVHLGEDVAVEQVGDRLGQRGAIVVGGEFEQVGDVGRVERLDQSTRRFVVAGLDRLEHGIDEFGLEPIVPIPGCRVASPRLRRAGRGRCRSSVTLPDRRLGSL